MNKQADLLRNMIIINYRTDVRISYFPLDGLVFVVSWHDAGVENLHHHPPGNQIYWWSHLSFDLFDRSDASYPANMKPPIKDPPSLDPITYRGTHLTWRSAAIWMTSSLSSTHCSAAVSPEVWSSCSCFAWAPHVPQHQDRRAAGRSSCSALTSLPSRRAEGNCSPGKASCWELPHKHIISL